MKLKKVFILCLTAILIFSMFGCTKGNDEMSYEKQKAPLKFTDGKFKVMMISDIQDGVNVNQKTIKLIETMLDREQPDYVMIAGDIQDTSIRTAEDYQVFADKIAACFEEREIYWSHVFGNHDDEYLDKQIMQNILMEYEHCLSLNGPEDIFGIGNYVLQVSDSKSEKTILNLWAIDSNTYLSKVVSDWKLPKMLQGDYDYDRIHFDQIQWYYNTSKIIEQEQGYKVPGIMFMHIALPETRLIAMNPTQTNLQGEKNEDVYNSAINSGMFSAILDRGDVKGVYFGHDHVNTFDGYYCGIHLGYDGSAGYATYGLGGADNNRLRGARIFEFDESDVENYTTRMLTAEMLGLN